MCALGSLEIFVQADLSKQHTTAMITIHMHHNPNVLTPSKGSHPHKCINRAPCMESSKVTAQTLPSCIKRAGKTLQMRQWYLVVAGDKGCDALMRLLELLPHQSRSSG